MIDYQQVRKHLANLMSPLCDDGCDLDSGLCDVDERRLDNATRQTIELFQQFDNSDNTSQSKGLSS